VPEVSGVGSGSSPIENKAGWPALGVQRMGTRLLFDLFTFLFIFLLLFFVGLRRGDLYRAISSTTIAHHMGSKHVR